MSERYFVPRRTRMIRASLLPLFRGIFHLVARVKMTGQENIPADGAYMIVFNHVSIYDPPFLVSHWPTPPEILGADDVWTRPGQSTLARLYGGIPIHRGEVDRTAMGKMLAALRAGRPLLVAPEGTRSHQPGLQQGKPGIAYLIDQTHVPIVPVGVIGTTDEFLSQALRGERPPLELHVGRPFTLPEFSSPELTPKEIRQRKADYIMGRIAALLPHHYRGVYNQQQNLEMA